MKIIKFNFHVIPSLSCVKSCRVELQYITERHCLTRLVGKTQYRLVMHVQYTAQDATKIIIAMGPVFAFGLLPPT